MLKTNKDILIVTSHFEPNIGGVETHLADLTKALVRRKFELTIATYNPLARNVKVKFFEKRKKVKIYRLPWPGFNIVHKLTPYPALEFIYLFPGLFLISLYTLFRNPKIKVLHAQGLVPGVVSLVIGRLMSRRVVVSTHNLYFFPKTGLYRKVTKAILSSVDCLLCLSEASLKEMLDLGVPKEKVRRFHYWLDLSAFKPLNKNEAKKKVGLVNEFVIIFVGRLIETKGIKLLLEASRTTKKTKYLFAGLGPLEEQISKEANKNKDVIYLGAFAPASAKLRLYLAVADILSAPSLVDEGYGRVAMEAIACGTPVLATRVGGLSEVVGSKVGWLVERSSKDLKNRLIFLRNSPLVVRRASRNTRAYALKHFSESNVEEIIYAYQGEIK